MSNMKCSIKCPICGEMLQKYGEIDPDAGTSIVLGANCPKCGIGNSDIKLWQELIRTRKALDVAVDALKDCEKILKADRKDWGYLTAKVALNQIEALTEITALEQKDK